MADQKKNRKKQTTPAPDQGAGPVLDFTGDGPIYLPDGSALPNSTPAEVKAYAEKRGITEQQALKEIEADSRANLTAIYGPEITEKAIRAAKARGQAAMKKELAAAANKADKKITAAIATAEKVEAEIATAEPARAAIDAAEIARASKTAAKAIEQAAAGAAAITKMTEDALKAIGKSLNNTASLLKRMAAEWAAALEAFLTSPEWAKIQTIFPDITEDDGCLLLMAGLVEPIIENAEPLKARIKDYEQELGHPPTFEDLIDIGDDDGALKDISLLEQFLIDVGAFDENGLPIRHKISNNQVSALHYPLDKVNGDIWGLPPQTFENSLKYAMETRKAARGGTLRRKPEEITLTLSLDFGNLEANGITVKRNLTNFDKRVYIAIASLYFAGNDIVTLTEIYRAMGNKTKTPASDQLENIDRSITKMMFTQLRVDDRKEHEKYNYDIDDKAAGWNAGAYDGPLLAAERVTVRTHARGRATDKAIHIFREPALVSFARLRGQISTIDLKLLQAPMNKTEGNLAIEDYLLNRIARAKNAGKKQEKVLFKTIYDKAGIQDKKQKQRAPEKIRKYLDYYKEQGFIKTYELQADNVTAYF